MNEALVELIDVHRDYRRGEEVVHALAGVSLAVAAGELLVVTGPSGSGKSTLLHVMAGLDHPSRGQILLEGTPISEMSDDELTLYRRRRLGFIFQFFHLLPTLTAVDNVALPLLLDGIAPPQARRTALGHLERLGLAPRAGHRPRELSGGEQQRVAVARALVCEPAVLLADEPTGNLDSAAGADVYQILGELPGTFGTTIVMVTHDEKAVALGDRALRLVDGELVERSDSNDRMERSDSNDEP